MNANVYTRVDDLLLSLRQAGKGAGLLQCHRVSGGHQVAVANASAGRKVETLRIIAQLQTLSSERYVSPYGLAQIYAALNDKEQTFKWLQIAYDDRAVWMAYLAVDPVFDDVRSDQRFQDVLRRVHLLP